MQPSYPEARGRWVRGPHRRHSHICKHHQAAPREPLKSLSSRQAVHSGCCALTEDVPRLHPPCHRTRLGAEGTGLPFASHRENGKEKGLPMALEKWSESHKACAGTWTPRVHMHAHTLYTHAYTHICTHTLVSTPHAPTPTCTLTHTPPPSQPPGPLRHSAAPLTGKTCSGLTLIVEQVPPGSAWPPNATGLRGAFCPRGRPDRWLRNTRWEIY